VAKQVGNNNSGSGATIERRVIGSDSSEIAPTVRAQEKIENIMRTSAQRPAANNDNIVLPPAVNDNKPPATNEDKAA
jgi:hypothetical protein